MWVLAVVMSGLRWRGSSVVAGSLTILELEPVSFLIVSAKPATVYSSGLPMLKGPRTLCAMTASRPATWSET